ncbi:type IV secretion system DNA-binding domain-containing protein [Clostridium baratii]|uniref:type IV secretion system DNA-binding domain-containing protein n=1 Tax=Clostridium baratii TaxID=1561 RepID=UPI003D332979
MKSIKISDYFELRKPTYKYIQIIPHKSVRNYNSSNIAKAIANTYRSINRRIYREKKKLIIEYEFKISYIVDIDNNNTNFYFIVPTFFLNIALEKINEIWNKATIKVLEEELKPFSEKAESYSLSYKKLDGLSLKVDKKLNEPLNSILAVMDVMKEGDRVMLCYNFIPRSQFGFLEKYEETENKFKNRESLDKPIINFDYIVKNLMLNILKIMDNLIEVINDFTGTNENDKGKSVYESMLGIMNHQNNFENSKYKKTSQVIDTQILINSESVDKTRRSNNALSVCQALRVMDGDNELKYKPIKTKINLEDFSFKNCKISTMSTEEVGQLIQIPGRTLLTRLGIKHVKIEESKVPIELQKGVKRLGIAKYKGSTKKAYLENEYNIGNLPLTMIGGQGAGKSTLLGNYAKDCCDVNEGLIVLDFIKECGLSEVIKSYVPKNKLIELDMAQEKTIQGLGYNEILITKDMSSFDKLKLANLQSQQVMSLIDSISVGDPLSSRMRRFLNASANIVFVQGKNSIKNVVECLENHKKRSEYINNLNTELKQLLEDEITTLNELNEWSKVSSRDAKEGIKPEIIGTSTSKIEHILDRISMLREDFKLKYMFNKGLEDNINLVECMNQSKVVLIKMKEGDFPTKMAKNMLITYWISKIWLASQLRGMKQEKPNRVNILADEIFQAPTTLKTLEYILPQSRKFGCKFVFSTQYIRQLESIFDTLEASGSSYMLLKGCLEDDFNHFKSKLEGFEYEDLRDMEQFSSLNLIYYSGGYSSFITKLPKPI